ncbi:MAG: hemagglutinin repeat-containing protein, partial [Selenomonas sp.]|nr:hemagglutinin repeat-containing protein [Selenomonas sp.]
ITTTENKFSSASIGASFTPSGLTDISISANKANGNSKESVTSYSPALVSAKNDLSLTSGKDMDIIGSKAQGEKITAKVGGSLNIETLQEKETYEEDNHSTGFGVSWNVNQTKKETTDANGDTKIETLRSFSKPTFSGSWNKGNIDSHYRSARDQAGFFAGSKGFDIYVEKNTDLKGGIMASEASPEKNKLTTGTLTFSDLENAASYKVSDKGVSLHVGGNVKPGDKGLLPATHMPIHGSASSVTKSAVSSGAIEILRRPIQDLAGLSRNTDNAQKPLEKIFDKDKILEQQEAAELFGELANRTVGDIAERMHWKEGDPRNIFLKSLTAGIMNRIAGGSFGKGMTAGAVNELLIARLLSWQDAYGHPIIPTELLQGISYGAGMAIDGTEGAVIAQSGTKHNIFEHLEDFLDEQEREAFLKAVEACGGDEYEVAQVFEQGGYLQRALSRIGKTPTPGYEYKPIIYTKADGTKFVRIVEVEKNASTKTPDEDGFTKTNIIDDKNSSHTEERIYWGPWRRTTQIAEKPKADTENTNSNDGNATMPIQKDEANNKDSKGNRSNDKQGEKTRGNSTETTGNPKDNSKKENTDPNRERRVELGKTIGIETFKFGGDLPVTLLNKQADSLAKEYRSLQKEIPAYVVKQGRLTKVGVLSPLGLIYDTYQDAQKYNGEKFVVATVINGASFAFTLVVDNALVGTGVGAIAVPFA